MIKFLTNLFFYLSFLLLIFSFFLIFVNLLLTSCKAPVFVFLFFYVEPQVLTQRSRLLLGHFVTRISPFTGPREKATFLFLVEARNWLFGFRFFLAVKRPPCLDQWLVFSLSGLRPLPLLGYFFHCWQGSKTRQSPAPLPILIVVLAL